MQSISLPNGKALFVNESDGRGIALIESGGSLNAESHVLWKMLVAERPWSTIVDVGANYGEMLAAIDVPAAARLIAVEPNRDLHAPLALTLAGTDVRIVQAALSDRDGTSDLTISLDWSGWSRLDGTKDTPIRSARVEQVPMLTLASLLAQIDLTAEVLLVKIDVEGHEVKVLDGAASVFRQVKDFAAMIEIEHLPGIALASLTRQFQMQLLDPATLQLVELDLSALNRRGDTSLHWGDAVLRPRRN